MLIRATIAALLLATALLIPLGAQEKSVRPGVNDTFRDPDPKAFTERFEIESREVFAKRKEILEAIKLKPTDVVADIGAGTGLFTRLFASNVGPEGRVIAVDIAQKFLDHIEVTCREQNLRNVETLLCKDDSTELPPESVDVAFICDTYHHFEFPQKTMTSLLKALKPGGRVILIDFKRIQGESTDWTMDHVRAGQEVFEAEILQAGFQKADEVKDLLKENYMVVFEKAVQKQAAVEDQAPTGRGRGRGMGAGRGPGGGRGLGAGRGMGTDAAMRIDQDVFHYLLERHERIRREVKNLDNGVETITESDDEAVSSMIQEHVAAMHERVKTGRGLRFWDELFVAIFKNHDKIKMVVENTEHGVKVTETSDDAYTVKLIQAHAVVVSKFVKRGFDEAHENHPVPAVDRASTSVPAPATATPSVADPNLLFPIIEGYGGVVAVADAVEPPRAGMKLVLDVTSEAKKPEEVNKGLDRASRLLNLYGTAGLKASDIRITVVLHGEATKSVLSDEAWESRLQMKHNPNLPLIRLLQKAGVEVIVCGQALSYKKIERGEVAGEIPVAAAALTVLLNRQADGFAYVPVP
jgi:ubiquinone/menaquinone biosynthesis C-methylase UbiE/intracellular sulfur oxidation DsrE/DsrF family protein